MFVLFYKYENSCRLFPNNAAVFGLAPGQYNFISQLYEQKLIKQPLLSIYRSSLQSEHTLRFGGVNNKSCVGWKYYKSSKNAWKIKIKSAIFNGFEIDEEKDGEQWVILFLHINYQVAIFNTIKFKFQLTIDSNYDGLAIPTKLLNMLIKGNILFKPDKFDPDAPYYEVPKAAARDHFNLHLSFTLIDGQELKFGPEELMTDILDVYSYINVNNPTARYIDDASFVLGGPMINKFCWSINFETNEIGFSKFKKVV